MADTQVLEACAARCAGSSPARATRDHHFADEIAGVDHPELAIGGLRSRVVAFDVKPDADDVAGRTSVLVHRLIQLAKHAASPEVLADVDALHPPEPAVAPVAPLVGHHELADDR